MSGAEEVEDYFPVGKSEDVVVVTAAFRHQRLVLPRHSVLFPVRCGGPGPSPPPVVFSPKDSPNFARNLFSMHK